MSPTQVRTNQLGFWTQKVEDQLESGDRQVPDTYIKAYRLERKKFYQALEIARPEFAIKLLNSIMMLIAEQQVTKLTIDQGPYGEKYRELEKLMEKISNHDLVRRWPGKGEMALYSPRNFKCRHGKVIRLRKQCVLTRAKLEQLRSVKAQLCKIRESEASKLARSTFDKRQQELLAWLKKRGVDASTANPDNYCKDDDPLQSRDRNLDPMLGEPSWLLKRSGKPTKSFRNDVILRLVPLLLKIDKQSAKACETLQNIFRLFFGLKDEDADSLERQWRRLTKRKRIRENQSPTRAATK